MSTTRSGDALVVGSVEGTAFFAGAFFADASLTGAVFAAAFLGGLSVVAGAAGPFLAGAFAGATDFTGDALLSTGFLLLAFVGLTAEAVTVARPAADVAAAVVRRSGGESGADPGTVVGVLGDTNNLS